MKDDTSQTKPPVDREAPYPRYLDTGARSRTTAGDRRDYPFITIEETQVARYHAFEEPAPGFTVPDSKGINDRHFFFSLAGAIALPAVIYYRTRHTRRPSFSVRINDATLMFAYFI